MNIRFKKSVSILYFSICFLFLFTVQVNAYIDPSVMTYAIQAIAGIAITLGSVIGIYWRKIRNILFLNQGYTKENMESDHLEFRDPDTKEIQSVGVSETHKPAAGKSSSEFSSAFALSLAMAFMLCFYTPLEIYFTNIFEFPYDFYGIIKYIVLLFLIVLLVLVFAYFIVYKLSKKLFYGTVILGTITFIAFYIQGNFLIKDLPPADGTKTDWSQFHVQEMQSLILWIVVTVVCITLAVLLKRKNFFRFTKTISLGVTGILAITLITVAINNNGFQHKADICISNQGLDTLSSDKNFVVFVVDSTDSKVFETLMNTVDPEYQEIFRDFTYYPDTLAAYPYTTLAVPQILTGEWYLCQDEFQSYFRNALKNSSVLNRLKEEQYLGAIYSEHDVIFDDPEFLEYENLSRQSYQIGNVKQFMLDELRLAFYLYMPYQLKKYEPYAIYNLQNEKPADFYYNWLNPWIYNYFDSHPIQLEDEKRFRFIHVEGAHVPLRYDKDLNEDYDNATFESNTEACVTVINKYLESLKESGAYDNTAIVILADHGYIDHHLAPGEDPFSVIPGRQNPLLMIKGWNESHPLEISDLPITYDYLPEMFHNLLDGKTGESVIPETAESHPDRKFIAFVDDDFDHLPEMILPGDATADEKDKLVLSGKVYTPAR